MSTVLQAQEPSARYLADLAPPLVRHFDLLATAPGGMTRLRELILTLAVQGRLVPQEAGDEPASVLLDRVAREKARLAAVGTIKRSKPQPPVPVDDLPFESPAGWAWVRLGTLLQKIGAGSTPLGGKQVYLQSGGVKFLRSQNVWNDGLRLDGVAFIRTETHRKMAGTVVTANDLLFNITGASIGRCAVVPSSFDEANVSQHVTIVRPVLPELGAFLHKVLISRHVQQTVMDVQVGVSREGLSVAKLADFLIPIPPLAEQSRIVARVEELMRLCDALEAKGRLEAEHHSQLLTTLLDTLTDSSTPEVLAANWQRVSDCFDVLIDRPEAVDALERTILQLAVRGTLVPQDVHDESGPDSLGSHGVRIHGSNAEVKRGKSMPDDTGTEIPIDLPAGWIRTTISDLCSLVTDGEHATPQRCEDRTAVPLVTAKNVRSEKMDYSQTDFVSRDVAEKCWNRCKPQAGDILMVSVGATLGRLCVLRESRDMVLVRSVTVLRPIVTMVNPSYLALHLMAPASQSEIWASVKQSAQPCLYLAKSAALVISLPPLAEQLRIVAKVGELRGVCAELRSRLTSASAVQSTFASVQIEAVSA